MMKRSLANLTLLLIVCAAAAVLFLLSDDDRATFAAADSAGAAGPRSRPIYFVADVMPMLNRFGCNSVECHGSSNGKGGLRLSMFGASPEDDYAAITRTAAGRRINKVEPLKSLLLLKVSDIVTHKGAKRILPGSPEYDLLASWIAAGAPWGDDKLPVLTSIKVTPEKRALRKGESLQLAALAVYSDGSEKDVTRDALCRSTDAAVATADAAGKVTARDFGEAAIIVSYMRRSGIARVIVAQPLPMPFPEAPANNEIDRLVLAKLKELGLPPSDLCTDQEFVRRVYLDVIGILPTPEEARAFLADAEAKKRSALIDRLLDRPEFADFWALKWGDLLRIKSEYPINLWPNAVQAYYHWVRDSLAKNKPYDRFATELLVATGSNFRNPAANYYRAVPKRDPQSLAEATALVFMGARLGCARCHGHPTENWSVDDDLGMAAFFAQVQFKGTQEWKEEIVFVNPDAALRHPVTKQAVAPKFLDGPAPALSAKEDPRPKFAEWLTSPANPWFAKNIVNRVWCWLLGRGIIHRVDDLRPTNPATNPELLAFLEKELVENKFDLKRIYRLILNSRTYQLSSKPNPWNAKDAVHFSHYRVKRLGAEQLLDAIGRVTESPEGFGSKIPEPYAQLPDGFRATQLFDGSIGVPFLDLFGRPPHDTPFEDERSEEVSMRQALHLINSTHIEGKISKSPRIARLLKDAKNDAEIVEEIYLSALSRPPSEEEKQRVLEFLSKDKKNRAPAVQDFMWAVLSTKEFLFNH